MLAIISCVSACLVCMKISEQSFVSKGAPFVAIEVFAAYDELPQVSGASRRQAGWPGVLLAAGINHGDTYGLVFA